MPNFRESLMRKLGPLPVWAWGVLLGLAILIGVYYYNNQRKSENAGNTVVSTDDVLGTLAGEPAEQVAVAPETTFETNTSWRAKAVMFLIGRAISPLTAQRALDKYLQGEPLTAEEGAIVNTAITNFGLPPDGVFGIPSISGGSSGGAPSQPPSRTPGTPTPNLRPPIGTVPSPRVNENFTTGPFFSPIAPVETPVPSTVSKDPVSSGKSIATGKATKKPKPEPTKASPKPPVGKAVSKPVQVVNKLAQPYRNIGEAVKQAISPKSKGKSSPAGKNRAV